MKLKEGCKYNLMVPTSMGLRITPKDRQPVHVSREYLLQANSAESNVLGVSASLGLKTKVLTAFVKDSPLAQFIKSELRARNIDYEGPEVPQGGPWGYRHQINVADCGYGLRGARVWNDRAGEVGRTLKSEDFDMRRIFYDDGVQILHMSGLFAAMSPETVRFCLDCAHAAKDSGSLICFDLNYRASFWKGRETELKRAFTELASVADILVGNEEDFQLALGVQGPEAGGKDLAGKIGSFKSMIQEVKKKFTNASVFATTLREVVSANDNLWGAILHVDDEWFVEEPRNIPIIDRIGGGDGFVSGLLYAVLRGWEPIKWLQFGWASGALVVTLLTDYAAPADEEQIWSIYRGNARVKR
ncbi:MAG: 2-dehydro-3-deoxygluconokinase [Firmicutes bacterium ADurb.Bin182]|nr:MAG: 2-dehydro-3-deoxygluconokinase [Firmicutes bacterium ADurb.Bin182]